MDLPTSAPMPPVMAILRAPVTGRTWRELPYLLAGAVVASVGFALTVAFLATGVILSVTLVGVPLVALTVLGARRFAAMTELREVTRSIHPPALDRGLDDALATLAARSGLAVGLHTDITRRPSPAIETIAYFCAAELLTNVAKHSGARRATIAVTQEGDVLRVQVGDDGHGGAQLQRGRGLAGLADRIRPVDGRLDIASPAGGPTVVSVELPCS